MPFKNIFFTCVLHCRTITSIHQKTGQSQPESQKRSLSFNCLDNKYKKSHKFQSAARMMLSSFHKQGDKQAIMTNHRLQYNKFKSLVTKRNFHLINLKELNQEKDLVIQHLNDCDNEDLVEFVEQLSVYQERYLLLARTLAVRDGVTKSGEGKDFDKLVEVFEEMVETQTVEDKGKQKMVKNQFPTTPLTNSISNKLINSVSSSPSPSLFPSQTLEVNKEVNKEINKQEEKHRPRFPSISSNTGLSAVIFEFFENKQKQYKTLGFKDLIDKRSDTSSQSAGSRIAKKMRKPNNDLEIKKLLEENKRLHVLLDKRSREDMELNQFEKNVLREEKERCMKRIEQLEQEVQQLARNNYKYQQIQRSQRQAHTIIDNPSITGSRSELNPYFIKPRPNNLQIITEKNKQAKLANGKYQNKDEILKEMAEDIAPIEKKEQHSFQDSRFGGNQNILGLLDRINDDDPVQRKEPSANFVNNYVGSKDYSGNQYAKDSSRQFGEGKLQESNLMKGTNFDSFSMAQTAWNNSSLFLNASKNIISIDTTTSTRNKVSFFKQSLILYKDQSFQIGFKKSNLDPTLSHIRIIFYIQNKTNIQQNITIQYQYQTVYYVCRVTQKLREIGGLDQGREVVEISLHPDCRDLNSVIDMRVLVGPRKFDLWVPVSFISWEKEDLIQNGQDLGFMTVKPDRQFASYESMAKIAPLTKKLVLGNEVQAYLFGRSRLGNHEIKLTWNQKQLTIDANNKILDFLAFLFHHFK